MTIFVTSNQTVIMSSSPPELLATAGGASAMVRTLGFGLGPALVTLIWAPPDYTVAGMQFSLAVATELFEETSDHIARSELECLPVIARRLYHGCDLKGASASSPGSSTPRDAAGFEDFVARLRATPEWDYVERVLDIRLAR